MKEYYLAYGSNLNIEEMKYRCPSVKIVGTLKLDNYHLVFKWEEDGYSYLTIEFSRDSYVPLCIFKINEWDIKNLDVYEGYPALYSKNYISINIYNKKVKSLIYVMNSEFTYYNPGQEYYLHCLKGYNRFNFDNFILELVFIDTNIIIKKKTKEIKIS